MILSVRQHDAWVLTDVTTQRIKFALGCYLQIDIEKIDGALKEKFVQLHEDEQTKSFLTNCFEKSDAVIWQLWHSIAIPFLKMFMTQTNVNGYLGKFKPHPST